MATATSTQTETPTKARRGRKPATDASAAESTPHLQAVEDSTMSDSHKEAMKNGRMESAAIAAYLDALVIELAAQPRGRQQSLESLKARLETVTTELADKTLRPILRVQRIQEKMDLEAKIQRKESVEVVDIEPLKAQFVAHARSYSERKGVSYKAWREFGIAPEVLKEAGLSASS